MLSSYEIITTEDGSHTIYLTEIDEHYHSHFGAIDESMHVFIKTGLEYIIKSKQQLNILEIGFGTGLNALLTLNEAEKLDLQINYSSIEAYPVPYDVAMKLNYPKLIGEANYLEAWKAMHNPNWNGEESDLGKMKFSKQLIKLDDFQPEKEKFDLVYFDAFSPKTQEEMWTNEVFQKMYHSMRSSSVIVTYSCSGIVKRAMKAAGFKIEKVPGPKGKREILRGIKQ